MKTTKIYWTPFCDYKNGEILNPECQILFNEPESVYKNLLKQKTTDYLKCPAFIEICKNTYVITSPFDMEININKENKYVSSSFSQSLFDVYCRNRLEQTKSSDLPLITLPPHYVIYSDEDVMIELLPCFLQTKDKAWNIVPGTFNIGKWIRPIEFVLEILNNQDSLSIKSGDPLFYIKFRTPNNSKVELIRVPMTKKLNDAIITTIGVKAIKQNLSLKTLYKMAESFLSLYKKPKKCPFHFWKK